MKSEKKKVLYTKIIVAAASVMVLGLILYCMVNNMGLIDDLDFGAGAYYYADIPEFTKYMNGDAYQSETPVWILTALFLLWGCMMYGLWSWGEKKTAAKNRKN